MSSLKKLWEAQYETQDDQLSKEAAAHGYSTEQYLEKLADLQVQKELQEKQASEDRFAYGMTTGDGWLAGVAAELNKFAAAGGDAQSAMALRSLFCELPQG